MVFETFFDVPNLDGATLKTDIPCSIPGSHSQHETSRNLGNMNNKSVADGCLTYLFVQASVFGFHYPTLYLHYTEDLHNFLCYSHWMGHLPRNIYPTKIVRTAVWITLYFICVTKSLYASGTKIQPLHSCQDYSGVKVAFLVFPHLTPHGGPGTRTT